MKRNLNTGEFKNLVQTEKVENLQIMKENNKIMPVFPELLSAETLLKSVTELAEKERKTTHVKILQKLLEQIKPVDFTALTHPEVKNLRAKLDELEPESEEATETLKLISKYRVSKTQFRILTVKEIVKIASENSWGLCKNHDFIYLFDGTHWEEVDQEIIQKFLGEAAARMGVRWDISQDYLFNETLFKQFNASVYLSKPEDDKDKVLINLQNGTFEIESNGTKLRQFDRNDFITYQLPFSYDPDATAPIFESYLNRVLPDIQRQKVLAEFLGYIFIKNGSRTIKEEKSLLLYGTGANGKSVLFEIINAMLGSANVSNYSLQSITNENGYFRAKLVNKLVNYASEINGKLEASIFKQLVSGEPVEARLPYGQPFVMRQYARLIFNCNELPRDAESTSAFYRRLLIIPFDVTIPTEEQDKQLHTKIIESELTGVFNWLLDGLKRLLEQKRFSECEAANNALEQFKLENDSVNQFLNENGYCKDPDNYKIIKELYSEYRSHCFGDGIVALSKVKFNKQLLNLGYPIVRVPGTGKYCINISSIN